MKKLIVLILVCCSTFSLYAQDDAGKTKIKDGDSKTKIKDDKSKTKDDNGKMKTKDNDNTSNDDSKMKLKDNKAKIKDENGKTKVKGENNNTTNAGTMNNGMGTMNSSTNVNIVTIGGWTTNPATLPIVGTGVSQEVVNTLKNKYGSSIYDIKQITGTSGQSIYIVRVMENGGMRSEYVDASGNVVVQ